MSEQGFTAPGWYRDPSGRHELRWWDGANWRDAVTDRGTRSDDPLMPIQQVEHAEYATAEVVQSVPTNLDARSTDVHTQSEQAGGTAARPSPTSSAKITLLSAKKIATELQSENTALHDRVRMLEAVAREFGGLDAAGITERIDALRQQEAARRASAVEHERAAASQVAGLQDQIARAQAQLASVEQDIIIARDRVELEARALRLRARRRGLSVSGL